ncbi:MAG: hypothetical protein AB8B53_05950 [Flavobacteriales bacterium]
MFISQKNRFVKKSPLGHLITNSFKVSRNRSSLYCHEYGDHQNRSLVLLNFAKSEQVKVKAKIREALEFNTHVLYLECWSDQDHENAVSLCRRVKTDVVLKVIVIGLNTEKVLEMKDILGPNYELVHSERYESIPLCSNKLETVLEIS